MNHLKPIPLFTHKYSLIPPSIPPHSKEKKRKSFPSCSKHSNNQTPINHIKTPKPKPPKPSTAHYLTQSPLKKTITIYAPELVTLAVALH